MVNKIFWTTLNYLASDPLKLDHKPHNGYLKFGDPPPPKKKKLFTLPGRASPHGFVSPLLRRS